MKVKMENFYEQLFLTGAANFSQLIKPHGYTDVTYENCLIDSDDRTLTLSGSYEAHGRKMDCYLVIRLEYENPPTFFQGSVPYGDGVFKEQTDLGPSFDSLIGDISDMMIGVIISDYDRVLSNFIKKDKYSDGYFEKIMADLQKI